MLTHIDERRPSPVFAAGLGIQQLGEILSPLVDKISADYKKLILGVAPAASPVPTPAALNDMNRK